MLAGPLDSATRTSSDKALITPNPILACGILGEIKILLSTSYEISLLRDFIVFLSLYTGGLIISWDISSVIKPSLLSKSLYIKDWRSVVSNT